MGAALVKLENKTFEHWVSVGIAIGEKYLILWFFEIVGEAEGVVASHIGPDIDWFCIFGIDVEKYRDIGFAILYFFASSTPSIIVAFGCMGNFHSIFKNWVIFYEIDNVEGHLSCNFVLAPEHKPLGAFWGVEIPCEE